MSKVPKSIRKELAALAAKPESEIDFSDVPATTERDWRGAERGKFYRPVKRQLTVRIDADVIECRHRIHWLSVHPLRTPSCRAQNWHSTHGRGCDGRHWVSRSNSDLL